MADDVPPKSAPDSKFVSTPVGIPADDPQTWAALNGLNLPPTPSRFAVKVAKDSQNPTAYIDALNDELRRDPELRDSVRVSASADKSDIRAAAADINKSRIAHGAKPLQPDEIDALADRAYHAGRHMQEHGGGVSISTFAAVENPQSGFASIAIAPPEDDVSTNAVTRVTGFITTDKFEKDLLDAHREKKIPVHELGHSILGNFPGSSEREGDSMELWRAAQGEPNMEGKFKTLAAYTDLHLDSSVEHRVTADVFLRMRHDLQAHPKELHALIDGKTPSEVADVANSRYVAPSRAEYRDMHAIEDAYVYARQKIGNDDAPLPTHLTRDGAVTLLRVQLAAEENLERGKDNGLTKAMPELWKANPQAFRDAQAYMHDNYGIDVQSPVPGVKPKPQAAPRP